MKEVMESKDENLILHAKWTLWFDHPKLAPADNEDWKQTLMTIGSFDNIEDFWRIFNNVRPPSMVSAFSNFSIFRNGIEPSWEHPENQEGGKFVVQMPKKESRHEGKMDEYWIKTVLACIGETMDRDGNQVCGAVVSLRKNQDKIALWTRTSDKKTCTDIGLRWKKVLGREKIKLRFQTHKDAAASGHSFRNEAQFEV